MLPLFFYIKFPLQMKSISIFICVFILFSLFFSCQNIENENVIARVGNCELTTFDYSKTYSEKILNTGIVDSDLERERHLNQLIRLKLFADASIRDDIALDSLSNKLLQIDSIKIIKDELFNDVIKVDENISENTLRDHYKWMNKECQIKHLFFDDSIKAFNTFVAITNKKISFDKVAKDIFKNEFLKENGGNIGWIKYDDLDPNLEAYIFPAPTGKMSKPIRSSYGWHIMIKVNERAQILVDEFSFNIRKKNIKQGVIKKLKQVKANNYVNDLMMDSEIIINDTLSNIILNAITKILDFGEASRSLINPNEEIMSVLGNLKKYKDLKLASYKNSFFYVEDLISGMRLLNLSHLKQTPSKIFHLALRNKILFEEGMKKNIYDKHETKMKLKDAKDRILSRLYLKKYFNSDKMNVNGSKYLSIADSLAAISKPVIYQKRFSRIFDYKDHN